MNTPVGTTGVLKIAKYCATLKLSGLPGYTFTWFQTTFSRLPFVERESSRYCFVCVCVYIEDFLLTAVKVTNTVYISLNS